LYAKTEWIKGFAKRVIVESLDDIIKWGNYNRMFCKNPNCGGFGWYEEVREFQLFKSLNVISTPNWTDRTTNKKRFLGTENKRLTYIFL